MIEQLTRSSECHANWWYAVLICLVATLAWFVDSGPALKLMLVMLAMGAVFCWGSAGQKSQNTILLSALVVAMLVVGVKDDVANLAKGEIRVSNVYHYYLGSKYFDELGYTDLYVASLAADREGRNYWTKKVTRLRDLNTYQIIDVNQALSSYDPNEYFSPDRWNEFKLDVRSLSKHRSASDWRNIFRDRGYNGTPLWTALARSLTAAISADGIVLLCMLDILLLGAAAVAIRRVFGVQMALLVLLLFVASPTNVARAVGGFLQFDWLVAIVASVCLFNAGRFGLAGAAMAFAIMTRAFPAVFVASLCLPALIGCIRNRWIHEDVLRYVAGVTVACVLLALMSLGNGHGVQGWYEFFDAISLHGGDHVLGERRVGLEHIFTTDLANFGVETDKLFRADLLTSHRIPFLASSALLLGLWFAATYESVPFNALLLGIVALFVVTVLSRYYFGVLALLPLLVVSHVIVTKWIVAGQLAAFLGHRAVGFLGLDWHAQYVVINAMLAVYFFVLLVLLFLTAKSSSGESRRERRAASEIPPFISMFRRRLETTPFPRLSRDGEFERVRAQVTR